VAKPGSARECKRKLPGSIHVDVSLQVTSVTVLKVLSSNGLFGPRRCRHAKESAGLVTIGNYLPGDRSRPYLPTQLMSIVGRLGESRRGLGGPRDLTPRLPPDGAVAEPEPPAPRGRARTLGSRTRASPPSVGGRPELRSSASSPRTIPGRSWPTAPAGGPEAAGRRA
jgi:hypothetical protein